MCEGRWRSCHELLEPRRAAGVHDLMTRLLGRCSCEHGEAEVIQMWASRETAREEREMVSA